MSFVLFFKVEAGGDEVGKDDEKKQGFCLGLSPETLAGLARSVYSFGKEGLD